MQMEWVLTAVCQVCGKKFLAKTGDANRLPNRNKVCSHRCAGILGNRVKAAQAAHKAAIREVLWRKGC